MEYEVDLQRLDDKVSVGMTAPEPCSWSRELRGKMPVPTAVPRPDEPCAALVKYVLAVARPGAVAITSQLSSAAHNRFENSTVASRLSTRPHARRIPEAPPTDHRGDPRDERA